MHDVKEFSFCDDFGLLVLLESEQVWVASYDVLCFSLKRAGKDGMQIVVAAMHKLLHLIYGVVKNNTPFDPKWAPNT